MATPLITATKAEPDCFPESNKAFVILGMRRTFRGRNLNVMRAMLPY